MSFGQFISQSKNERRVKVKEVWEILPIFRQVTCDSCTISRNECPMYKPFETLTEEY